MNLRLPRTKLKAIKMPSKPVCEPSLMQLNGTGGAVNNNDIITGRYVTARNSYTGARMLSCLANRPGRAEIFFLK